MRALALAAVLFPVTMAVLFPVTAHAEKCGTRASLVDFLLIEHGETPTAVGIRNDGRIVELLVSEDGATWTLLMSQPNGISCGAFTGTTWMQIPPKPGIDPKS